MIRFTLITNANCNIILDAYFLVHLVKPVLCLPQIQPMRIQLYATVDAKLF